MIARSLAVSLFLLTTVAGSIDSVPSFSLKRRFARVPGLELRGGAGPIEAETAAKVVGGIAITAGSVFTVSDKFCLKAYDVQGELSSTDARLVTDHNISILGAGLVMYSLLFRKDISFNLAMALGNLPWTFRALSNILNECSKTTGPSNMGSSMGLAVGAATMYAGLTDAAWASSVFKASAIFGLASGLPLLLAPGAAAKLWEIKGATDMTNGMLTGLGVTLTGLGALLTSLAWGDDIITAVGKKAMVDALACMKAMYFSPEWASIGVSKTSVYLWLIIDVVAAFSILVK
eukprot:scaffold147603_cov72-Cyclotella_meneghiniana.AAC.1